MKIEAILPPGVEHFCFPDSSQWPPPSAESAPAPAYTIVLTDANGDRLFGHCRRIVPEGEQVPIPITYCLLSRHRSAGFYAKVFILFHKVTKRNFVKTYKVVLDFSSDFSYWNASF